MTDRAEQIERVLSVIDNAAPATYAGTPPAEWWKTAGRLQWAAAIVDAGWAERKQATNGAELIAAERNRQIDAEGYTIEHDAAHGVRDLVDAGIAYAALISLPNTGWCHTWWPWSRDSFKPSGDRVRDLVKAGALIAAAIDAEVRRQEVSS